MLSLHVKPLPAMLFLMYGASVAARTYNNKIKKSNVFPLFISKFCMLILSTVQIYRLLGLAVI